MRFRETSLYHGSTRVSGIVQNVSRTQLVTMADIDLDDLSRYTVADVDHPFVSRAAHMLVAIVPAHPTSVARILIAVA